MTDLFYGTSGPRDAKIMIVGEGWGPDEDRTKLPFVGGSGQELTRMLADADIARDECFLTNITPTLTPRNRKGEMDFSLNFVPEKEAKSNGYTRVNGLVPLPQVRTGLVQLQSQIEAVRPKVIIALGNYTLWALTRNNYKLSTKDGVRVVGGIGSWRGSYLESNGPRQNPVLPTFHPADIMRVWSNRNIAVQDFRRAKRVVESGVPPNPQEFITNPTFGQAINTLDMLIALPAGAWLTCDVETFVNHVDCIGFAWSRKNAICIPFFSKFTGQPFWTLVQEQMIHARLRRLFARTDLNWSNQNIAFDLRHEFFNLLNPPRPSWDTMVAHHLCFPGTEKGLDMLASLYCEYYRYWGEAKDHTTDAERWHYNCIDCCSTFEITEVTRSVVEALGLSEQMQERLDILWEVAIDMMERGVAIDMKLRHKYILELVDRIAVVEAYIDSLMPEHIKPLIRGKTAKSEWYRSPTQQAKFFYELCGVPAVLDPKTKRPTVDADALPKIKFAQPLLAPMVDGLDELRTLAIYYNQASMPLEWNNRLSSSFNTAHPISFRWSSSENAFGRGGNLQNIAKEKDDA